MKGERLCLLWRICRNVSAHVSLSSPACPQLRERATCPLTLKPLQEVCRPQSCKPKKPLCLSDPVSAGWDTCQKLRGVIEPQVLSLGLVLGYVLGDAWISSRCSARTCLRCDTNTVNLECRRLDSSRMTAALTIMPFTQ